MRGQIPEGVGKRTRGRGRSRGGERKEPRRDMDGRGGTGGGVVETQRSIRVSV